MKNLKFPEIEKKVQQSVYGAWGGSSSYDPTINGGWLDEVVVGGGGNSGGSSGDWDWGDIGQDNGGWGDQGSGGGGGSSYDFGDNFISSTSFINVAEGDATTDEFYDVDSKIRGAVNATGLAAGFTGTAMDGLTAITKEIGFSAKTFGAVGTKIGAAGVVIGGVEVVIAAKEAVTGENPWTDTDTLNAISTSLGVAALVPGPHSIICGGLSIMIALVGTAYSN
jgi:hypothetical protein